MNGQQILIVMDALIHLVESGYGPAGGEIGFAGGGREARAAVAALIVERDELQARLDATLAHLVGGS